MGSIDNFHALVKRGVEEGEIELGYNHWVLNKPGSQVYSQGDHVIPTLFIAAIVAYSFYIGGIVWGLISLLCGILLFLIFVRGWVMLRLEQRTRRLALSDADNWTRLWESGALSLRLGADPEIECFSGRDDWIAFARRYLIRRNQ